MSKPDSGRLGDYDIPPSKDLQKAFGDLTKHKLPGDLLVHKLGGLSRSYGHTDDEKEATQAAFAALVTILKTKPALRDDVANYIASRHLLHEPFRKYLRDNGESGLTPHLANHTIRRALL